MFIKPTVLQCCQLKLLIFYNMENDIFYAYWKYPI